MRTFLKVISLSSALLLAGNSPQIYSSEQKIIDLNSNILISNAIEEKEIKTVTANGFGTTIESAAQNAAENALTNVVGSFLDVQVLLKEKTKISDGILSQTSIIKENINDYSQGSIKYFEILNVQEKDSIYIVTARVDVRIEDFRAYIKELASDTKEISTTNLFAAMGQNKKNLDNKYKLLKEVVRPLNEGQVIDIKIGDLITLENFLASSECIKYFSVNTLCNPRKDWFQYYLNKEKSVIFKFSMKINEDYLNNSLNILNNISDKKKVSYENANNYGTIRQFDNQSYFFYNSEDIGVVVHEYSKNQNKTTYFMVDKIRKRIIDDKASFTNPNNLKLRIHLLDKNDETLYSFKEKCNSYAGQSYFKSAEGSLRNVLFSSQKNLGNRGIDDRCLSHMIVFKNNMFFDIRNQKDFFFSIELNDLEVLNELRKLKIEFIK